MMEDLPESLVSDIVRRLNRTADRNTISLVCKHLYAIDAEEREFLKIGCGLHPATKALTSFCSRFQSINQLEISYSGWMPTMGKQLTNQDLLVLTSRCSSLTHLTLSFCTSVSDAGLSYLASFQSLKSLKLNFAPEISSDGLLLVVAGCKNLSALHLIRCMKVSNLNWLEHLGELGKVEDLAIKSCTGISEDDLIKLGPGWKKLKSFEFEMDACCGDSMIFYHSAAERWQQISCQELKELSLVNCVLAPGRGLSYLLTKCEALEKLHLEMCTLLKDSDLISLSQISSKIRSVSINLSRQYFAPVLLGNPLRLSDNSLKALARGCPMLEVFELTISDGELPSFSPFTQSGLLELIRSCPIRALAINCASFIDDLGFEALCSARVLQKLELVKCQGISDKGLQHAVKFPSLNILKIGTCPRVTDNGLKTLVGLDKLEYLTVEDCPHVSKGGVQGVARNINFS